MNQIRKLSRMVVFWISLSVFVCAFSTANASYRTEEALHQHLFGRGYNKNILPTQRSHEFINVFLGISVNQIVDLDEQRLMMTTSLWVDQSWQDIFLRWNPEEFDNITSTRIPSDFIWIPGIVLMENADGNFTSSHPTKAVIRYDGLVQWSPPAVYKSTCAIDATFFPFDMQNCTMKFASWSYDARQVRLYASEKAVSLRKFTHNGEWDVVDIHVINSEGDSLQEDEENWSHSIFSHPKVTYCFILRRLPLFYCTFLIAPCLGISFLTSLVFYLPSASQEKITLSISVLLAHIFYLLVITEIMPASSKDLPLLAEYLLLNMIFITLSIVLTSVVLNVHYRSETSHRSLPSFIRSFVLETVPTLIWMEKPDLTILRGTSLEQKMKNGLLFKKENLIM
ncbi:neuronal acetylcholine receptor subunit beta-3-like [Styela clava]